MAFTSMLTDLLRGLGTSLEIFFFTLLIALPLGFPLALGRMSKNRLLSGVIGVWISVVRGTPLMLQIIFVYFAPYILFGMPLSRYPRLLATVLAFGLNYGAYFAEIYRGGILSVDPGQREAANMVLLGTMLSIVTLPIVMLLLPLLGV
jgi:His/Glu/Gln/Arg/opine family amino acid ABC transporter permease subunit